MYTQCNEPVDDLELRPFVRLDGKYICRVCLGVVGRGDRWVDAKLGDRLLLALVGVDGSFLSDSSLSNFFRSCDSSDS